jgi:hypothetical protein
MIRSGRAVDVAGSPVGRRREALGERYSHPPELTSGIDIDRAPFRLPQATSSGGPFRRPPKSAWIPQPALGYAEKVRPQFLSLRHPPEHSGCSVTD